MESQEGIKGEKVARINRLTGAHKRVAEVVTIEIQELSKQFGINRIGFLTLTFEKEDKAAYDMVEANRKFKSLRTGIIEPRYERVVKISERSPKGRIHFHMIVVLPEDIRTGVNFNEIENGIYRSAGAYLKSEWKFWRETAPNYGFGRTELLPVKSTADGIARYVGKYVNKHIGQRKQEDKGHRLVSFIGYKPSDRHARAQFSWNTPNAWLWRRKLEAFCKYYGQDLEGLKALFGSRWCYYLQSAIMEMTLSSEVVYPTSEHACAAGVITKSDSKELKQAANITISTPKSESGSFDLTREKYDETFNHDPVWSVDPDPKYFSAVKSALRGGKSEIEKLQKQHDEGVRGFQEYFRKLTPEDRIKHKGMRQYDYKKEASERWNNLKRRHKECKIGGDMENQTKAPDDIFMKKGGSN